MLEVQFVSEVSQVLIHCATLVGQVDSGTEVAVGPDPPPPIHLVHTVEVEVRVTVEAE